MRLIWLVIIVFNSLSAICQPIVVHKYGDTIIYRQHHVSLGAKHDGIGFGNFIYYNGIKLSVIDKDTLTNGVSLSLSQKRQPKRTNGAELAGNVSVSYLNGLALGVLNSVYVKLNGFSLGIIYDYNFKTSGLGIAGFFRMNDYLNGASIAGFADVHHRIKGFTFSGAYEYVDSLSGVSISGVAIDADNTKGVTITAINTTNTGHGVQIGLYNEAKDFKGIQIGLINIIKSKKHLKFFPFINIG